MLWNLPNITVSVEPLFYIGPLPFTSTLLLSIVNAILVFVIFYLFSRRKHLLPGRIQGALEWLVQAMLGVCEDVAGKVKGRKFFPWVFGIFLFVLMANLWEVIPGVETIGTINHEIPGCENAASAGLFLVDKNLSNCITPLLRPPSTDLNFTLAIAIVSVVVTQIYGWRMLGVKAQIGRYLTLREGVIGLFVGVLEAVLELARIISFGFRLFGNLFAGSVLLLVISFLVPFVGAIPFYFLEIFVSFIQAFVFAMLTLIFLTLGTTGHGHEDPEEEHAAEVQHEKMLRVEQALER
ncbi:MAG: F0F1 ATP synthase subunit A [Nitrososphaerota archaeon]